MLVWYPMVCLFHGDYGAADPAFSVSGANGHGWTVDAGLLKEARNIGEAQAIQRHVLRGEAVSWCHQGYSWVDQDAIGWFYIAAFVFVVLPHLVKKIKTLDRRHGEWVRAEAIAARPCSAPILTPD